MKSFSSSCVPIVQELRTSHQRKEAKYFISLTETNVTFNCGVLCTSSKSCKKQCTTSVTNSTLTVQKHHWWVLDEIGFCQENGFET